MSHYERELFSAIKVPSERRRILDELVLSRAEILIKGDELLHRLTPIEITNRKWLVCAPDMNIAKDIDPIDNSILVNFAIGADRYFFQSSLQFSPTSIVIELSDELFHLQRRRSMRLSLPAEMSATSNVINHADRSCLHECQILDFSTGGLRLLYPSPSPDFKSGEKLVMVLHFGKRKPFQVVGHIRHSVDKRMNNDQQIFGVEFSEVNRLLENKLLTLQLDLQGEIFRKWKRAVG